MAMLWAFATGHAGMTSVHGETADHGLRNLARFALTAGAHITTEQALDWLREIDIVVHCTRPSTYENGEQRFLPRQVDEIVEVQGVEGNRLTAQPTLRRQRRRPAHGSAPGHASSTNSNTPGSQHEIDCSDRLPSLLALARSRLRRRQRKSADVKLRLRRTAATSTRCHSCARSRGPASASRELSSSSGYVLWHNVVPARCAALDARTGSRSLRTAAATAS